MAAPITFMMPSRYVVHRYTQEEVQQVIDSMSARIFNTSVAEFLMQGASNGMVSFYDDGSPTPNGMHMLALARRLGREQGLNLLHAERMYSCSLEDAQNEAKETRMMERD